MLIGRMLTGFAMPMTPIIWGLVRPRATATQIRKIALTLGTVIALGIALSLVLGGILPTIGANWKSIFWVVGVGAFLLLILALGATSSGGVVIHHHPGQRASPVKASSEGWVRPLQAS